MTDSERLRLIVFGSSIVSDWRNPLATSARPLLASLIAQGHDVLFLEERHNAWLVRMLKARGMAPVRSFEKAYPTLQHRSYSIPSGYQRTIEFAQHVGSADAIVALPGTPRPFLEEINAFRSRSVVRAVYVDLGDIDAEIALGPVGQVGIDAEFGPAVDFAQPAGDARTSIAVVAYEGDLSPTALHALATLEPIFVDQFNEKRGRGTDIPEVNLPWVYAGCHTVVVTGDWRDPLTWARLLLPLASGCRTIAIGSGSESAAATGAIPVDDVSLIASMVREFPHDANLSQIPDEFAASRQARDLIDALRRAHDQKRRVRR